jgi:hypothetical protein
MTLATHIASHNEPPVVWEIYGGGVWVRMRTRCGKYRDVDRCVSPADATCEVCMEWLRRNNEMMRDAVIDADRHGLGAETAREWRP